MKTFDYIQDPGHGWIKVPVSLLINLNIDQEITCFSYYRDGFAYLEEDCDASRFFNAYRAKFGADPKLRDRIARERRSRVREYTCYTKFIASNIKNQVQL